MIKAAVTLAAGLPLAAGLSIAPAGAAVTSNVKAPVSGALQPETLTTCSTGANTAYSYHSWCGGTGPTSYRVIVHCANGELVLGVEYPDGTDPNKAQSTASCQYNNMNSTLQNDWGIILCSNNNGAGTYQGYRNRHDDISQYLLTWGNGNIATGGTYACELNTNGEQVVSPIAP
jgi:hypothetical protein